MTLPFVLAVLITAAATPVIRTLLIRSELYDVPNHRSSHTGLIVRGGGIAVLIGALSATLIWADSIEPQLLGLVGSATFLAAVGLIDDRHDLSPKIRLTAQFVAATVAVPLFIDGSDLHEIGAVVFAVFAIGWIVGYVNVFNFMDGINGISVMQGTVAGLVLAIGGHRTGVDLVTAGGLIIAAACIGFAPFNAWRATVFLGDVGSYFIGSWLAALLALALAERVDPLTSIAPFALYVADAASTIVRRVRRGADLFSAHREHAYQRLAQRGWSHLRVTVLVGAVMIVSSAAMTITESLATQTRLIAFLGVLLAAMAFAVLPDALARATTAPAS